MTLINVLSINEYYPASSNNSMENNINAMLNTHDRPSKEKFKLSPNNSKKSDPVSYVAKLPSSLQISHYASHTIRENLTA